MPRGKWQYIARVLLHGKHMTERDPTTAGEKLQQESVLLLPLRDVFHRGARAFVRPSRQWPTKVGRENCMRNLMGQDGIKNPLLRSLDRHGPTERLPVVEGKAGRSSGSEMRSDLDRDGTRLGPPWQLASEPFDGQIPPVLLRHLAHASGESGGRCGDNKIRGSVTGTERRKRGYQDSGAKNSSFHAPTLSMLRVGGDCLLQSPVGSFPHGFWRDANREPDPWISYRQDDRNVHKAKRRQSLPKTFDGQDRTSLRGNDGGESL